MKDDSPGGGGFLVAQADCPGNAREVLESTRSVLRIVLEHQDGPWPTPKSWRTLLPEWFVDQCAPEESRQQEHERSRTLAGADEWTLDGWLYWFEPAERQWFWWDASVVSADLLRVTITTVDSPTPTDALDWLLRACAAERIEIDFD